MANSIYPRALAKFVEYIKIAHAKAVANLANYQIAPEKLSPITQIYDSFIALEAIASNPDTATTGIRRERDIARTALEAEWRKFLNENIRYNSLVNVADLTVFGIKKRDTTRTPAGIPFSLGSAVIRRTGEFSFEVQVFNQATGKRKHPLYAAGSYIYVAVTEIGATPAFDSDLFHKKDFSSTSVHLVEFKGEQLGKQAHIYARYANAHGKEGPAGAIETVLIS